MLYKKISETAERLGCGVYENEPLSKHTTFRIGGGCKVMICPENTESLSELVRLADSMKIRTLVMGNGSNMLCADEGFDGAVFQIGGNFSQITFDGKNTIRAQAGASLMKVCKTALEYGLSGLEFAYGIPGTVGGAVYMNAGAYGGEMKDVVSSVTAMTRSGELKTYDRSQLGFTYRRSRFSDCDEIIVGAEFSLTCGEKPEIEKKMNELMSRRREKQPLEFPNAGSTFKRPEGQFAGRLIEECGLKGAVIGGAQVSCKHCGFVINKGGATGSDVRALIDKIQKTVFEKTGFYLECEVRIIPYKET